MTPQRIAEVYRGVGFHVGATARLAGLSIPDTRRVLQSHGYLRPRSRQRPRTTEKALALLQAGYTKAEARTALAITNAHMCNIMRRQRDRIAAMDAL